MLPETRNDFSYYVYAGCIGFFTKFDKFLNLFNFAYKSRKIPYSTLLSEI